MNWRSPHVRFVPLAEVALSPCRLVRAAWLRSDSGSPACRNPSAYRAMSSACR